ncbi:TPA_asm: non-structural polyprotein, partial [Apostichopus japonicus associated picornavirus 1]
RGYTLYTHVLEIMSSNQQNASELPSSSNTGGWLPSSFYGWSQQPPTIQVETPPTPVNTETTPDLSETTSKVETPLASSQEKSSTTPEETNTDNTTSASTSTTMPSTSTSTTSSIMTPSSTIPIQPTQPNWTDNIGFHLTTARCHTSSILHQSTKCMQQFMQLMYTLSPVNSLDIFAHLARCTSWESRVTQIIKLLELHGLLWHKGLDVRWLRYMWIMLVDHFGKTDEGSTLIQALKTEELRPEAGDDEVANAQQVIAEAVGVGTSIPPALVTAISVTIAAVLLVGGSSFLAKEETIGTTIGQWIKDTGFLTRHCLFLKTGLKELKDLVVWILADCFGFKAIDPESVQRDEIKKDLARLVPLVEDLQVKFKADCSFYCEDALEVKELIQECDRVDKRFIEEHAKGSMGSMVMLEKRLNSALKIVKENVESIDHGCAVKLQPVTLWLWGKSGLGKSSLTSYIIKCLCALERKQLKVHTRASGLEFFDGYYGQQVLVYDDFTAARKDTASLELQQIYSPAPYIVNKASLNDKGMPFQSRYLLICSNDARVQHSEVIGDASILERRRDFVVHVTDPLYKPKGKECNPHWKPDFSHLTLELTNPCPSTDTDFVQRRITIGELIKMIDTQKKYRMAEYKESLLQYKNMATGDFVNVQEIMAQEPEPEPNPQPDPENPIPLGARPKQTKTELRTKYAHNGNPHDLKKTPVEHWTKLKNFEELMILLSTSPIHHTRLLLEQMCRNMELDVDWDNDEDNRVLKFKLLHTLLKCKFVVYTCHKSFEFEANFTDTWGDQGFTVHLLTTCNDDASHADLYIYTGHMLKPEAITVKSSAVGYSLGLIGDAGTGKTTTFENHGYRKWTEADNDLKDLGEEKIFIDDITTSLEKFKVSYERILSFHDEPFCAQLGWTANHEPLSAYLSLPQFDEAAFSRRCKLFKFEWRRKGILYSKYTPADMETSGHGTCVKVLSLPDRTEKAFTDVERCFSTLEVKRKTYILHEALAELHPSEIDVVCTIKITLKDLLSLQPYQIPGLYSLLSYQKTKKDINLFDIMKFVASCLRTTKTTNLNTHTIEECLLEFNRQRFKKKLPSAILQLDDCKMVICNYDDDRVLIANYGNVRYTQDYSGRFYKVTDGRVVALEKEEENFIKMVRCQDVELMSEKDMESLDPPEDTALQIPNSDKVMFENPDLNVVADLLQLGSMFASMGAAIFAMFNIVKNPCTDEKTHMHNLEKKFQETAKIKAEANKPADWTEGDQIPYLDDSDFAQHVAKYFNNGEKIPKSSAPEVGRHNASAGDVRKGVTTKVALEARPKPTVYDIPKSARNTMQAEGSSIPIYKMESPGEFEQVETTDFVTLLTDTAFENVDKQEEMWSWMDSKTGQMRYVFLEPESSPPPAVPKMTKAAKVHMESSPAPVVPKMRQPQKVRMETLSEQAYAARKEVKTYAQVAKTNLSKKDKNKLVAQSLVDGQYLDVAARVVRNRCDIPGHCRGLMVRDRMGISVCHAFDGKSEFVVNWKGKTCKAKVIKRRPDKDFLMFELEPAAEQCPDITKHFIKAGQVDEISGYQGSLHVWDQRYPENTNVITVALDGVHKTELCDREMDVVEYRTTCSAVEYRGPSTALGDCGNPLLWINPRSEGKLLGIHNASSKMMGTAALITRQDLDVLIPQSKTEDIYILPYQQVIPLVKQDVDGFKQVGLPCDKEGAFQRINYSRKTKIYRSPLAWSEMGDQFEPAVLSKDDPRKKNDTDPYETHMRKWTTEQKEIDVQLVDECFDEVAEFMASTVAMTGVKTRVLSKTAAINRDVYIDGSNPLYRQSSAGYPYATWLGVKQKVPFLIQDKKTLLWNINMQDQYGKELNQNIDQLLYHCGQLHKTAVVFSGSLKDEPLKMSKIEAGRTRTFAGSPLDFTIAYRKYFHSAVAAIHQSRNFHPIKIGINPQSVEWNELANYLEKYGDVGFDSDYKHYDANVHHEFVKRLPKVYNRIYQMTDPNHKEQDDVVREGLYMHLEKPILSYYSRVVMATGGIVSGEPSTSLDNSIINFVYYLYVWKRAVRALDDYTPWQETLHCFLEKVRFALYGDDNICIVHPSARHIFTPKTFKTVLETELHQTITSADKGKDVHWTKLENMQFLKRMFVKNGRYTVGPLTDEAFDKMLSWDFCHKPHIFARGEPIKFDPNTIQGTVQSAILEGTLRGEKFWRKITAHLLQRCMENNIPYPHHGSYNAMYNAVYFTQKRPEL